MGTFMILTGILGYLMVGTGLGRITFIRVIGDSPRYNGIHSTFTYDRARWTAIAMLLIWPVALLFGLMYWQTPIERIEERRQQLDDAQKELELIGRKYHLDFRINDPEDQAGTP